MPASGTSPAYCESKSSMPPSDAAMLESGEFADVMTVIRSMSSAVDVRTLMLIGARCRDLLNYHYRSEIPARSTIDTDIAMSTPDWGVLDRLREEFSGDPRSWQRCIVNGVQVDIVPFGGIENPSGHLERPHTGDIWAMDVSCYGDVFTAATTVKVTGVGPLKIPTVPGFAVLKLLAWLDRGPQGMYKDAQDLSLCLSWYHGDLDFLYADDNLWTRDDEELEGYEWFLASALLAEGIRHILTPESLARLSARLVHSDWRLLSSHFTCREAQFPREDIRKRTVELLLDRVVHGNPTAPSE